MSPRAKTVKTDSDKRIVVEFQNGELRIFDVKPLLKFDVYRSLQDDFYFERVFVSQGIVQWPDEEDISPDTLYLESAPILRSSASNS